MRCAASFVSIEDLRALGRGPWRDRRKSRKHMAQDGSHAFCTFFGGTLVGTAFCLRICTDQMFACLPSVGLRWPILEYVIIRSANRSLFRSAILNFNMAQTGTRRGKSRTHSIAYGKIALRAPLLPVQDLVKCREVVPHGHMANAFRLFSKVVGILASR